MLTQCSRLGLQSSQVRESELVLTEDSAEKLGLEDEDLIDVAMEQTRGAVGAERLLPLIAVDPGASERQW